MPEIVFVPDETSQKILSEIPKAEINRFLNDAVKAFTKTVPEASCAAGDAAGVARNAADGAACGVIDLLNQELDRLLGSEAGVCAVADEGGCGTVRFIDGDGTSVAVLTETDSQDILKSLRPPITRTEVLEILLAMQV